MNKKIEFISDKDIQIARYMTAIHDTDFRYLRINELKDGWTYRLLARKSHIGIWRQERKGFISSRFKFERIVR